MDIKEIKQLIDVMCTSTLTNLEIEQDGVRVKLERTQQGSVVYTQAPTSFTSLVSEVPMNITPAQAPAAVVAEVVCDTPISDKGCKEVKSPMVGTFHALTTKKIQAGSKLKSGDVLCIVEAMKLMNEISITEAGEIVSIEVSEGDMVEFGQVLFTYK